MGWRFALLSLLLVGCRPFGEWSLYYEGNTVDSNAPLSLVAIAPQTVLTNQRLEISLGTTNAIRPTEVVYSADQLPPNAQLSRNVLQWSPSQPGRYTIPIRVTEGTRSSSQQVTVIVSCSPNTDCPQAVVWPSSSPTPAGAGKRLNAKDFGAIGNGMTDDSANIQKAIDAATGGDTIALESGRIYLLGKVLKIRKSGITFDGNGATLLLNTSAYPENAHIDVESTVITEYIKWNEAVVQGQSVFHVSLPQDVYRVGDHVHLALGQDPYDKCEEHYVSVATILANDGKLVTLDISAPYKINYRWLPTTPNGCGQGVEKTYNQIAKINLTENIAIQNLRLDYVAGTVPNWNIGLNGVRRATIKNISGNFAIAVQAIDSKDIVVDGIEGELKGPHQSAGRAFSAWQSEGILVKNVNVTTELNTAAVFFESLSRHVVIDGMTLNWNFPGDGTGSAFMTVGGSYDIRYDNIVINNARRLVLSGTGGQPGFYTFGKVEVKGPLIAAYLPTIDSLTYNGHIYENAVSQTKTIAVEPNWAWHTVPLLSGTIKKMKFRLNRVTGVKLVSVVNQMGNGVNIAPPDLKAGEWVELDSGIGVIGGVFNAWEYPAKSFSFVTDSTIAPGTTIETVYEYYPQ